MSDDNKQHQIEPVAWVHPVYLKPGAIGFEASVTRLADAQVPLYTHADPGEVERLRKENDAVRLQAGGMQMELDELRAQLAERDALLERALRLLTPNVGRFRGSVGWAVEVDRFVAAVCCSGKSSAPVGDGVHDDTEAVRARLAANYFESKP